MTENLNFTYQPVFDDYLDDSKSTQSPVPGTFKIPGDWYRKFFKRNPMHIHHGWNELSYKARYERSKTTFPYVSAKDIHDKICRADSERIKRLMNLILGFEDNFIFASPDSFPIILRSAEYWRFMNWAVTQEVLHSGLPVAEWKKFVQFLKWKAFQSKTERPKGPCNFPGFSRKHPERLSVFWKRLTPWLIPIWYQGITTKHEGTRFCHFTTSRNMPAASKTERQKSLNEHFAILTNPGPDSESRKKWLFAAAQHYARSLKRDREKISGAHVSLTSSASFETPIKDGGRRMEIASRFRIWLMEIPTEQVNRMTWFGRPYWLLAGIPRWRTMCHTVLSAEGEPGFLTDDVEECDFTPGKFTWSTPLHCLDGDTGYQLFQWSIEEGIRLGYFEGSPYRSENTLRLTGKLPKVKATAIGEPGNKSRVVTVGEGWLTIFLQPLSHALIGILSRDPDARAGLGRAWQGFEYAKRWGWMSRPIPKEEERLILTSDLKTATDYCPHGYAKALLKGFIEGLDLRSEMTTLWVELLTSSREYIRNGVGTPTKRGILMGDPGTKLVLSLFNKVAEMEAQLHYIHKRRKLSNSTLVKLLNQTFRPPPFRCFAFAGDDHVAIGPIEYLQRITLSHIRNGMCVSTTTNYISAIAGIYCEEMILIRPERSWEYWGMKKPLGQVSYHDQPHVDAIKLRLLSVCRKEHEGKDETNPAIGMAATLRKMVAWFLEGWEETHSLFAGRFRQRMRGLIPLNPILACIPRTLGGIDAPGFDYTQEELAEAWNKIDLKHKQLITLVMRRDVNTDHGLRRILSQPGNNSSIRGVNPECFDEEIRRILSSDFCEPKKIDDFAETFNMSLDEWKQLRFHERLKKIEEKTDYITVSSAINLVRRPFLFRDLLFPEIVGQFETEQDLERDHRRAYKKMLWPKRYQRMQEKLDSYLSEVDEAKEQFDSVTTEEIAEAGKQIIKLVGERDPPDYSRDVTFIPKKVVITKSLCTLQLPQFW